MILKYVDYVLDRVTMYRLVLYYVISIIVAALGLSLYGTLPYTVGGIVASAAVLLVVSALTNMLFSKVFEAPSNIESVYITALILVCILPPVHSYHDLPLLCWAAVLAMASKYILAIHNKHIFNPAAIAVVLTGLWLNQSATWWVATVSMVPVVVLGGLLMVRKMRRFDMVVAFFMASSITFGLFSIIGGKDLLTAFTQFSLSSPLFFFAFVMFTEPLTAPATKIYQVLYAALVGFLFVPQIHIGSFYFTPELALVVGNIFAYCVSPKIKERLVLRKSTLIGRDIWEFSFTPARQFVFAPGQYMEFTLPHARADSRGNRRYFTLASSPTEKEVVLGIKYYPNSSTFKTALSKVLPQQTLMTGQLSGDFTLPQNKAQKLVFIAGGIGVTPFRSMIKYLSDKGEKRDIILMYMNKGPEDIVYRDIFDTAEQVIGLKAIYTITATVPPEWTGSTGPVDQGMITKEVPDYTERLFYISGPHAMVVGVESSLLTLGVKPSQIKKDFFPGLT